MSSGRLGALAAAILAAFAGGAAAKNYAPGISDTEIRLGQTQPYSGPNSALGAAGFMDLAFVKMYNDHGGINGRKITLLSLDDAYSPPKTLEQTRKLVEQDEVAFIYRSMGTASNTAIHKYLNDRKIPQLFIASGASIWNDPKHFPWTMSYLPSYRTEAHIYARYILKAKPDAKIAVLYQDDDLGKDFLAGLEEGLGEKSSIIVKTASYAVGDPTVDSQIITLQASGADVLMNFASVRAAAQAIRKAYDIGWRPMQFITSIANGVATTLRPAGLEKSVGIISATFVKDPTDPQWRDDPAIKDYDAFMDKYNPNGDKTNIYNVFDTISNAMLEQTLKQCGDDLSRENIMRQAANLHDLRPPMLLPGIAINTSPDNYEPIKQMKLERFNGTRYELFGELIAD